HVICNLGVVGSNPTRGSKRTFRRPFFCCRYAAAHSISKKCVYLVGFIGFCVKNNKTNSNKINIEGVDLQEW
ncbi:MAG: hypothetical protein ACI31D_05690, partial [Candidatus Limisoma sp.]